MTLIRGPILLLVNVKLPLQPTRFRRSRTEHRGSRLLMDLLAGHSHLGPLPQARQIIARASTYHGIQCQLHSTASPLAHSSLKSTQSSMNTFHLFHLSLLPTGKRLHHRLLPTLQQMVRLLLGLLRFLDRPRQ